jgi:hypothetical protein
MTRTPLSIGLRVRTGRCAAVAIAGTRSAPEPVQRAELDLTDAMDPASLQPFHLLLDDDRGRGERAAARAAEHARRAGARTLDAFAMQVLGGRRAALRLAVVANSDTQPERIGNLHLRAHALEGWLFREICEALGPRHDIEAVTYLAGQLSARQDADVAAALRVLGGAFGRPWHRDWKLAAHAAWLLLPD